MQNQRGCGTFIIIYLVAANCGKAAGTFIDELDAIAIFLFITSCLFSFLSIRQSNGKSKWLENIAEIIFLAGLSLLFVITILFTIQSFE